MSTGEHVLSALQFMAIAVIIVTLGRELPKAARRAWRMTRDMSFRWRRRRFIGRRQFTGSARQHRFIGRDQFKGDRGRMEIDRWRNYTQAILNEDVDGYFTKNGRPVPFGVILDGVNEGRADAIRALEDIRRRGYVSRRLTLAAWVNSRLPPETTGDIPPD